ncbi:MAG: large repetitive protein [Thermoanaerobaculia bacterium]|jgi:subtilase family serine protease|nr:large repetitive protein [Thermoanaerobaculia bacterium]
MVRARAQHTLRLALAILLSIFSVPAFPQNAGTVNNALSWLGSQQKANGTWGPAAELSPRDTARVLVAHALHNASTSPAANAGYAWLASQAALDSNQFLAEQALALTRANRDSSAVLARLAAQKSSAADFGAFPEHTGDSYDSAIALQALIANELQYQTTIAAVVTQLITRQNPDGGWGIDQGFASNPVLTAEVLAGLSLLTTQQPPPAVIAAAQGYLAGGIHGDGSIGANVLETAVSFRALALSGFALSSTSGATLSYLTTRQLPNGSWSDDVYVTARVLEAYASNKPNLVIRAADISVLPSPAVDGDLVKVTAKVTNIGAASSTSTIVGLYVDNKSGRQLATAPIGGISSGNSQTVTLEFTATNLSGKQTLAAAADPAGSISELRTDDNTATISLTIKGKPDLQVYGSDILTVPARLQPNQAGTLSVTLRNNGQGDATNAGYAIFDVVGTSETQLAKTTIDSIAAAGTRVVSLPVSLPAGSHTIKVVVDPDALIGETNETNNTATKSFAVSPVANIDLVVAPGSVIVTPAGATAGQSVTITATIANAGNTPTTANVFFFDGVPGQGGGYFKITPVAVEAQSSVDISTTYVVGPDTKVLYVVADADQRVAETDESNNSGFATITDQFIDLSITKDGLVLPRTPLSAGQQIAVRAVVRNNGVLPATNVEVKIYDDLPQTGGNAVVTTFVDIPAQGKKVISATWTLRAGQRFATVVVNPSRAIPEIDYANNKIARLYTVAGNEADLTLDTSVARDVAIDRTGLVIDANNMTLGGQINVRVTGNAPRPFAVTVFDDVDGDLAFNPEVDTVLGSSLAQSGISPQLVQIAVSGTVRFSPGHPMVYIDGANSVSETNESNNFFDVYQQCEGDVVRNPEPFWKWRSTFTSSRIAAVARIVDTNGDDFVDENDVPAVVMTVNGSVLVVRGDNGKLIWSQSPDSSGTQTAPVVADVDNDGKPEIIVHSGNTVSHKMICYNNDGTTKWVSPDLDRDPNWDFVLMFSVNYRYVGMPAVADLDGDGKPEIMVGRNCINGQDGTLKWIGGGGSGRVWDPNDQFMFFEFADLEAPVASDVDGDGKLDVIAGNTVYRANGSILWSRGDLADGLASPVYFGSETTPHIALVSAGTITMLNSNGSTLWGPAAIGARFGGAPTIFMDGTTGPWIGVAGDGKYTVFNAQTGVMRWQKQTTDDFGPGGTTVNAATAFDFGSGMTLIYPGRHKLWLFKAADGSVVQSLDINVNVPVPGAPTIADIDDDGHADLIINDTSVGVGALSNQTWNAAPAIWNEAAFHVVNVTNEMARIPTSEVQTAYSRVHYRSNLPIPPPTKVSRPNLVAGYMRADASKYPTAVKLTVRVGNNGWTPVDPVSVSFFNAATNALVGVTQSKAIPPGGYEDVVYTITNPTLGNFSYFAVADNPGPSPATAGTIVECDESDNRSPNFAVSITSDVIIDPASLAVSNTSPAPNERLDFIAAAKITGSVDTTALKAQFFLGNPASGGTAISQPIACIVSADAQGNRSAAATFSWNVNQPNGAYTIYVVFDPANAIVENNETNNTGTIAINVTSVPTADIAADQALMYISDPNPRPTDTVQLQGVARLNGAIDGSLIRAQFFRDAAAGTAITQPLPVIVSTNRGITTAIANANWTVDTTEGTHRIYCVFDVTNAVPEVDETNNSASIGLNVSTPQIIRKLSGSITLNPPSAEANRPVSVTVLVQNIGNVPMTGFALAYNVTGPGVFSGTKTIDSLAKNAVLSIELGKFTPTTNGIYTVTVTAPDAEIILSISPQTMKVAPFATAELTAVPSQVPISLPLVQCHTRINRGNTIVVADDPMIPLVKAHIQSGLQWQAPILNSAMNDNCFKCHVQAQGMVSFELSQQVSGITVDTAVESRMFTQTVNSQNPDGHFGTSGFPVTTSNVGAWALSYWKDIEAARPAMTKALDAMVSYQQADGHFDCDHCDISYNFPEAQTMMAAIGFARGYELTQKASYQTALTKATQWFLNYDYAAQRTRGPEFAARVLIGLTYAQPQLSDPSLAAAAKSRIATIASFLQSLENPDGSFGAILTPKYPIVRNAQCLYALARAGVPGTDPGLRQAMLWLINKQQPNGGWFEADGESQVQWIDESTWAMIALPAAFLRLGQFDADFQLFLPSNEDFVSANIAPTSSAAVTGGKQLKWHLPGVTDAGYDLFFNVKLNGLTSGESRPVSGPASITYDNPYTNEHVVRDVAVPSVTGYAPLTLAVSTDHPAYGPNTNVNITQDVGNVGTTNDGITTDLVIRDASGTTVATIATNNAVNGLPPAAFPGWHYAVPASIPVQVDGVRRFVSIGIDFAQKLSQLGVAGTFDRNSIRVSGDNAPSNELYFTWNPDANPNSGKLFVTIPDEVPANSTYNLHVYFDAIENGFKPVSIFDRALNGQAASGGGVHTLVAKYYQLDTAAQGGYVSFSNQVRYFEPPLAVVNLNESWQGDWTPPGVGSDYFVTIWDGTFFAPVTGTYQFILGSDDGSWLEIDGVEVINNGGGHAPQDIGGSRVLTAGFHTFHVKMFEWAGQQWLTLRWAIPGQGYQTINGQYLYSALPAAQESSVVVGNPVVLPNGTASMPFTWNTGVTAAAPYTVVSTVRQFGAFIGNASAPFTITPASALASTISTDKAAYNANEAVHVASTVEYTNGNTTLRDLKATIRVADPAGNVLATSAVQPIALMNPGQSIPVRFDWNTGASAAGIYTARLIVTDATGAATLAERSVPFEIKSTSTTGKGVSGTISVAADVPQGDNAVLGIAITNNGNAAVTGAPFIVQIVDPLTLNVVQEWTFTSSIDAGATINRQFTHNTFEEPLQQYLVFLGAQMTTPATKLADTKYTVVARPVVLNATVAGDKPFYDMNDIAHVTGAWSYLAGGRMLRDAKATVSVVDSASAVLATKSATVASMLPGNAAAPIVIDWSIARIAPGTYTAQIVVTDTAGTELGRATAPLVVRSTKVSGIGIVGTIATPPTVRHKDPLPISFTITNHGNDGVVDAPFAVQLVRASDSVIAMTLPVTATIALEETYSGAPSPNTKPLTPGVYNVVLRNLISGISVPLATTHVDVVPLPAVVAGVVAADKPFYDVNETVHVTSSATYTSGSIDYANAAGTVTITSPAGTVMATNSVTRPLFSPDAPNDVLGATLDWPAGVFAPGIYTAKLIVKSAQGEALGTFTTTFEIRSTAVTGKGVTGTISTPASVWEKSPLPITNVIIDAGNAGLTNAPFKVWIVDPATNNVLDTIPFTASAAKGASATVELSYDTIPLVIGHYKAVLVSMITGAPLTLASTPFEIDRVPLRLEMSAGGPARVIIWANCANGNSNKSCPAVEPAFLTKTLNDAGIPWTLVGDQYTFAELVRTGAYTAAILHEPASFEAKVASELLETIRGGFGMLYIKSKTDADPKLAVALGLSFGGKLNSSPTLLDVVNSPFTTAGQLTLNGDSSKITLTTAQVVAKIAATQASSIAWNAWGAGRVVTIPYDTELTKTDDVAKLLLGAVNYVSRLPGTDARRVVPIDFKVTPPPNLVNDITITATLPAGMKVVFAQPALSSSTSSQATWNVHTSGAEFHLYLWVRLPDAIGTYVVTGDGGFGNQIPVVTKTVTLTVAADRAAMQTALASDLSSLASTVPAKDQKSISDAVAELNATTSISGSDAASIASAIDHILNLIQKLETVSADTSTARKDADRLLLWWQSRS